MQEDINALSKQVIDPECRLCIGPQVTFLGRVYRLVDQGQLYLNGEINAGPVKEGFQKAAVRHCSELGKCAASQQIAVSAS